jgi:8-oxo-dGTP pyrophosphatase MutT (NUDIX family)
MEQQTREYTRMKNLHLTVAAIVADRDRYLMVEETVRGELVINQPAGHVEPGESLVEAVIREALEETAWQFVPEAMVGLYLWQHPASGEHVLRAAFVGTHRNFNPALELDTGIERTLWLSREELLKRETQLRTPMVMRGIDDYLAGKSYPLDVLSHLSTEGLINKAATVRN